MDITFNPTPFRTVHATATHQVDFGVTGGVESAVKRSLTGAAKREGLGKRVTRRSHVIGNTVTVFDIYRKS